MKALKKVLICTAAVALSAAAISFAACDSTETYEGEYKYENAWVSGSYYGVKVSVEVKDNVIQSVTVLDSDYIEATSSWDGAATYTAGKESLLAAYEGKTVDEILALNVATETSGAPLTVEEDGFISYGDDLLISGATQSSGRLLLAVQDALKNVNA